MSTAQETEYTVFVKVVTEDGHEPTDEEIAAIAEFVLRELGGEIAEFVATAEREHHRRGVRYRAATDPCLN